MLTTWTEIKIASSDAEQAHQQNCRFLALSFPSLSFWPSYGQNGDRQDFRITPYINYAHIYCLKKTKDRTKLSLWDFSYYFQIFWFFSKCFLKPPKFDAFCTKIGTFWNKFCSIFAFLNLTLKMTSRIVISMGNHMRPSTIKD